jgi:3-oxoacyl-[acyl-carrier-protein] synthase-3
MCIAAARQALGELDPMDLGAVIYFGSEYKDYHVWPIGAKIQHALGAKRAFAFEIMALCATGILAFKLSKEMLLADPGLGHILIVAGSKEGDLLDYRNQDSRFLFNFADGAGAAVISHGWEKNLILGSSVITDGQFAEDVYLPVGGSRFRPETHDQTDPRLHHFEIPRVEEMKRRLDPVSLPNFIAVCRQAIAGSGLTVPDVDFFGATHMKRSFHDGILKALGLTWDQTFYLEEYGHVQAADQIIVLKEASERGLLKPGQVAVVTGAGTGYTWGASCIRWG